MTHFRTTIPLLAMLAALAVACGSGDGDDPIPDAGITADDLVGQWVSTKHVFTNNADGTELYDVLADGGESRMTVLTGGGVRTFWTIGTVEDEWDSALSVVGTTVTIAPVETTRPVRTYESALNGATLTLTNTEDEFDFTRSDSTPVSATLEIEMTQQ